MPDLAEEPIYLQEDQPYVETVTLEDLSGTADTVALTDTVVGYLAASRASGASLLETFKGQVTDATNAKAAMSLSEAEVIALKASATFDGNTEVDGTLGYYQWLWTHTTGSQAIGGVDQTNDYFTVTGVDLTARMPGAQGTQGGGVATVSGSTGNDGSYPVTALVLSGSDTRIYVEGDIPDSTADGNVVVTWDEVTGHGETFYTRGVSKS